jgi:hypothetical protein
MAVWAAGGIWFHSSIGIGGTGGIPTFYGRYRLGQVKRLNGYPVTVRKRKAAFEYPSALESATLNWSAGEWNQSIKHWGTDQ